MVTPISLPPGFQRIGHGGASALAPANTLASFDAALHAGVDMVEFDVRACDGRLVLAHTVLHSRRRPLPLGQALRHLSLPRFSTLAFNLDVKHAGCEAAVIEELHHRGLLARSVVSSQVVAVLDAFRLREPRLATGISVGGRVARASRGWRGWRAAVLQGLTVGRWQALMAQHRLIDARLQEDVASRGGRLYAWTVNDLPRLDRLRQLGADGVVTADPRLFSARALWTPGELEALA